MDGWESRRRRTPGHDWCVVALGHARRRPRRRRRHELLHRQLSVALFDRRARHHSRRRRRRSRRSEGAPWTPLLPKVAAARRQPQLLRRSHGRSDAAGRGRTCGSTSFRTAASRGCACYGDVVGRLGARRAARDGAVDLAGDPQRRPGARRERHALRRQGQHDHARPREEHGRRLGDAAAARPRPRLGDRPARRARRRSSRVEIDTNHFKGNYPGQRVDRRLPRARRDARGARVGADWTELLPQTKLKAHHRHFFSRELRATGPVSHVRLNIFPDGGVSRLRVHGTVAPA